MLILSRKPGEILKILPLQTLDPATPIGELFLDGPIEITVTRLFRDQVRLGIRAHPGLLIVRQELTGDITSAIDDKRTRTIPGK